MDETDNLKQAFCKCKGMVIKFSLLYNIIDIIQSNRPMIFIVTLMITV